MRYYPYIDVTPTDPPSLAVRVVSPGHFDTTLSFMPLPLNAGRVIDLVGLWNGDPVVMLGDIQKYPSPPNFPVALYVPIARIRRCYKDSVIKNDNIGEY